ncbi:MAG: alpha/beta fold hydrolase [Candidatus Thorarchaeota archaeon]
MNFHVNTLRNKFDDPHHLIKTSDGKVLFLRAWEPKLASKNIAILIFHGITAYSGPYAMVAKPLSKEGYSVYGLDLRGHGLSDGIRGDYPNKERLVKDLCETIVFVKRKVPRVILLGHSLGVLSTLFSVNHCLKNISGLILLSAARTFRPGVYPTVSVLGKIKILISSILFPSKSVISYYREGMQGTEDPLFNFKYTFRFMKIFRSKNLTISEKLNFPVFVGLGEHDELFTIEAGKALYDEIPCDDKEFYVFPGAKHAEFPEGSIDKITTWLKDKF